MNVTFNKYEIKVKIQFFLNKHDFYIHVKEYDKILNDFIKKAGYQDLVIKDVKFLEICKSFIDTVRDANPNDDIIVRDKIIPTRTGPVIIEVVINNMVNFFKPRNNAEINW
jgi:hypothetical protein